MSIDYEALLDARRDARIEAAMDGRGDLEPPWARFPAFTRYTINWRMGAGEDWLHMWRRWLERTPDPAERRDYLRRHPRAPRTWADLVYAILRPGTSSMKYDEANTPALIDEGLVGDDVAFDAWVGALTRQHGGVGRIWHDDDPAGTLRYSPRALGFCARWALLERQKDPSGGWLDDRMPPPEAWASFAVATATGEVGDTDANRAEAERRGLAPRWPDVDEGLSRASVELAAAGAPAAPWAFAIAADSCVQSYEMDMGYADAWVLWLTTNADDPTTLTRYLRSQPPLPEVWRAMLHERAPWLLD